jgi:hypothetical protein
VCIGTARGGRHRPIVPVLVAAGDPAEHQRGAERDRRLQQEVDPGETRP